MSNRPTLFTGRLTRGDVLLLLLDEAGDNVQAQYDVVEVDIYSGEHKRPSFLRDVNPAGLVPVLQLPGGELLTETYAIALYMCREHQELRHLAPAAAHHRHNALMSWLFFLASELEPCMKRFYYPGRFVTGGDVGVGVGVAAQPQLEATKELARRDGMRKLALANQRIGSGGRAPAAAGSFALGSRQPSLVDVFLAYWVVWFSGPALAGVGARLRGCVEATVAWGAMRPRFEAMRAQRAEFERLVNGGGGGGGGANKDVRDGADGEDRERGGISRL